MSRTNDAIEAITGMIRDGALRPGGRLPTEPELMARLGMSRTPLREAVRALSLLGILETRQGAGTYVTGLDAHALFSPLAFASEISARSHPADFLAARRVLEVEVAGLAAQAGDAGALAAAHTALARADAVLAEPSVDHGRVLDADLAFHEALATAAGNPVIAGLLGALAAPTAGTRLLRDRVEAGASGRTHAEHRGILAAVEAGDVGRARTLMAAHLYQVEAFSRAAPEPDAQ